MQWAVSDLAFAGFNKKYLSGLPLTYNIEFFYEFGTDHYWDNRRKSKKRIRKRA